MLSASWAAVPAGQIDTRSMSQVCKCSAILRSANRLRSSLIASSAAFFCASETRGMPRWLVSANVRVAPPRTVRARSAAGESPAAGKVSNLDRAKANGGRVLAGDAEGEDETRVKN